MKIFIILFTLLRFSNNNKSIKDSKININYKRSNLTDRQITFNSHNKKNLIISTLTRFKWKKILPFVKSLIKANLQNYDAIIFVKQVNDSIIKNLKSFGINVHKITDKFENVPIFNYRWKVYNDFLGNNREKYKFVLSVDLKDTIIQNDIFSLYEGKENFLGFSLEDVPLKNGFSGYRIIELFGTELFETIKNEKMINAGTVWGTENEFFRFSQILWQKLSILPQTDDQSEFNYLYYHEKMFKNITIFRDKYGPVITIGVTKRDQINIDSDTNIIIIIFYKNIYYIFYLFIYSNFKLKIYKDPAL